MRSILLNLLLLNIKLLLSNGESLTGPKHGKIVVCYVASWAVYRPAPGSYALEDLEPELCTHLVYSFAGLNPETNSIKSLDPWQDLEKDYGKAGYKRLVALKKKYPHLKVTLAIGGWNEKSLKYSNMSSSAESRAVFIKSVMNILDNYQFDGLDLDWEYPTKRDGLPYDRENFVLLVKELKDSFESKGYILTAALGAGKDTMESAYDLAKLSRYLDLLHMMCYDYHGTWDGTVGANAPLKGLTDDDNLSVEFTVKYMLSHGVSPYKLVMGLPMYGRTFQLQDPATRRIEFGRTPVKPKGFQGPYTKEDGFMGYNEICSEIKNTSSWRGYWHAGSSTPYLRDENGRGDRIISYDNGRSIAAKVKMAMDYGLGGVMVWSIDTDDFKGDCPGEVDPYVDFVERHKRMVNDPLLAKTLENLHLRNAKHVTLKKSPSYVTQDGVLELHLPEPQYTNYHLMQVINDAISLSLEEKAITDEMERINRDNELVPIEIEDVKGSSCNIGSSLVTVIFLIVFMMHF